MSDFVHLHNHSDYSLLDAAQTVDRMCNRVDDLGMDSIAITEHGNLFSMIPFYKQAREAGIKPIIGCEIYVAVNKHTDKKHLTDNSGKKWGYHHLVLLAMNQQGYQNLLSLISIGYLEGFYYRPRVDKDLLLKYNEGLIATSACLAGEVTSFAAKGDYENAKNAAISYQKIFPDRFYLELQNHNIAEEKAAHKILKKLSSELNIPLVATNDCHYCMIEDSDAHDTLFCLGTGKDKNDMNRMRYEPNQFYIKSADEMYKIFKDTPKALENTLKIAEQCNVEIDLNTYHFPNFPIDDPKISPDLYLKQLCKDGIINKYGEMTPDIEKRLNYELSVIKKMGYAGYFLITQDFVNYAKQNYIPVGPGRGSAAGSIVAYSTNITDVDPLKYNLLFDRFLNADRVSMPDIDIDFCIEGRSKVIDYIKHKYGHDSVAQIITFGTLGAKSVVRDVGRVLGMSYGEVDSIAKLIPNEPKMTLEKALKMNPELKQVSLKSAVHKELMDYSKVLEGCHRHASTHAAGVVITPGPLTNYVPLFKNPTTGDITTQVDMKGLEDMGLLKMDFLGLRNLTVIDKTVQLVNKRHKKNIDISKISLEDKEVYKNIFSDANTVGVFQFESDGMREYIKQFKPNCIDEIVALTSLYRPGPMANIPEFINRKFGKSKIKYLHPSLEEVLKETYGIIVYQEQVMQIASKIGGFTLSESDLMRAAMGKKKKNLMASFKVKFVEGAIKQKINKKTAIEIFELLEKFAQYGFNKSHAVAYSIIAYQTAWLKYHYPVEFLTANISSDINDTDRLVKLLADAKRLKIKIKPPNINFSEADFKIIDNHTILFGLAAIKNVGYKGIQDIINYRKENEKFKSIFDLEKVSINKKILESLILVGACDDLKEHRAQMYNSVDVILDFIAKKQKTKNLNQGSLFSGEETFGLKTPKLPEVEKWDLDECLKYEKELLGLYITSNPMEKYENDLNEFSCTVNTNNLKYDYLKFGGIISDVEYRFDKNGNKWALLSVDILVRTIQVYVFNDTFTKYSNLIALNQMCFIIGKDFNEDSPEMSNRVVASKIYKLQNLRKTITKHINIRLNYSEQSVDFLSKIEKLSKKHPGNYNLVLHLMSKLGKSQKVLLSKVKFNCEDDSLHDLRMIAGSNNNVWLSVV